MRKKSDEPTKDEQLGVGLYPGELDLMDDGILIVNRDLPRKKRYSKSSFTREKILEIINQIIKEDKGKQ